MNTRVADLHLHTYYSDGTESPEQVVARAHRAGLAAIAITDHDTVAGIDQARRAATAANIEVIPATELSADFEGREIHILGYYIDDTSTTLRSRLEEVCHSRKERILVMLEKLSQRGISLSFADVTEGTHALCIGRLHLAMALKKNGFVASCAEAFQKYIGDTGPCYVSSFNVTPQQAVTCIREAGGVPVLAHPYILNSARDIERLIADGIAGLEVYHSDHTRAMTDHFIAIAQKHSLVITGGSDCHGLGKARVLMGSVKVPYILVERLRQCAQSSRL